MSVFAPTGFGARLPGKPLGRPPVSPFTERPAEPPSQKPFPFPCSLGLPAMPRSYGTSIALVKVRKKGELMASLVDKLNPTNQFHPYQPADAIPHSEVPDKGSMFS